MERSKISLLEYNSLDIATGNLHGIYRDEQGVARHARHSPDRDFDIGVTGFYIPESRA
jgi:hypothetical protein